MVYNPKILAFAGSLRTDSFNKKLVRIAASCATKAGGDVTLVDLRDYPMPIYDGDIEAHEGLPDSARELKRLMKEHRGFLISSPEYNGSFPAALKNAIDWASRQEGDEAPLECFTGHTAALLSASPGALGGIRALTDLRTMLSRINVLVIPETRSISLAHQAFSSDGNLLDPKVAESVCRVSRRLVEVLRKLEAPV